MQQTAIIVELAPDVAAGRRYGARVDLQFGQATTALQGSPANEPRPELYRNVWQAYGTYVFPVGRGLQTDFGKFASNLGYETNYAKDNHHFSRAYLFNFLPYYHSGVRVSLPVTDHVTLMYMLTNGIQQTEEFNDFKSSHVTAIVTPVKSVSWTISYYAGQEQPDGAQPGGPDGFFRVFDTYVNWTATDALTLALDVNHTTNEVNQARRRAVTHRPGRLCALPGGHAVGTGAPLRAPGRRRTVRRHRPATAGGHADVRTPARRRLPRARRVPARLVQRTVLHGTDARTTRDARRTRSPPDWCGGSATSREPGRRRDVDAMLLLGVVTFVAMLAFVRACERL